MKTLANFVLMIVAASAQTAPPRPARPDDALLAKLREVRDNPSQTVEITLQMVRDFPGGNGAENAGSYFASALRQQAKMDPDPAKLRALATRYIEAMAKAPGPLCIRANSYAATPMLENKLPELALQLINQTIARMDSKEYVEYARAGNQRDNAFSKAANGRQYPFNPDDWTERFHTMEATYYSLLGRAYTDLGNDAKAEEAYRKTYSIEPTAPAAMGIARLLSKKGDEKSAFDFMTQAALTGKLDRAGVTQFHELYSKLHNGSLNGLEEMLDARFRETYRNPIVAGKYQPGAGRTTRTALVEFFTGAGCVPCIPFDYTFEKLLETHTRSEVALVVYHMHAPTSDPMGNRAAEDRIRYYDVHGAPTPFLDGKLVDSPDNDVRNRAGAAAVSQPVYDLFRGLINKRLETATPATLRIEGARLPSGVHATVTANGAGKGTLRVALVETEVHYTGENGLRFHVMVVRSMASAPAGSGKFDHNFDLDSITAANLRYYDEYATELKARVAARGVTDFAVSFREHRNIMDPQRLALVAFVQDDDTKEVLQSAFAPVK